MQAGTAPEGTAWQFLRKLQLKLPDDPANSTSGYTPPGTEYRDTNRYLNIKAALFTTAKSPTTPPTPPLHPSTDEWINYMRYICTMA